MRQNRLFPSQYQIFIHTEQDLFFGFILIFKCFLSYRCIFCICLSFSFCCLLSCLFLRINYFTFIYFRLRFFAFCTTIRAEVCTISNSSTTLRTSSDSTNTIFRSFQFTDFFKRCFNLVNLCIFGILIILMCMIICLTQILIKFTDCTFAFLGYLMRFALYL